VQLARKLALDAGEEVAKRRIEASPYDLHSEDVHQENIGHQSGRVFFDKFYGRFFEYGTVHIHPAPFMRPAHRQMRKIFLGTMGSQMEGFVRRKVRRV
jgi:HK97 gp10 family phage protein